MKYSKIIVPAIMLGIIGLGALAYGTNALAFGGPNEDARNAQIEQLAQKLGVDQDKVSAAMDEIRAQRQQQRQEQVSSKLDEAVKDGVITSEQKQKIIDKRSEMRDERGRKKAEMEQWFSDNGIDSEKLHDYIGFGEGFGRGTGGAGRMMNR